MRRLLIFAAVYFGFAASGLRSQVPEIDDNFDQDPCTSEEWECKGSTRWVDPALPPCADPNTHDDCSIYPEEGYVLVTPSQGNQGGGIFRIEPFLYDNFRLSAVVELRDGSIARPADGMAIVIVGSPESPTPTCFGGALGAAGLGAYPTMVFEFDNWDCNPPGDNGVGGTGPADDNHVAFAYSATGFPCGALPAHAFKRVPVLLNNKEPVPARPNHFFFQVQVKNDLVTCDLANADVGLPKTRMYSYAIPDFEPFEGFLGVVGSTGGAWQNHIIHSIKIEDVAGICLFPPATGIRKITNVGRTDGIPLYGKGDTLGVTIELNDIREAVAEDPDCDVPTEITITEKLPAGWVATDVVPAPTTNAAAVITWKLTGAQLVAQTFSYKTVAATEEFRATFEGIIKETNVPDIESYGITGDTFYTGSAFSPQGFITLWNHLGPLAWAFPGKAGDNGPPGACDANTGLELTVDWIVNEDGSISEKTIRPFPGLLTRPKYGGDGLPGGTGARAAGLTVAPGDSGLVVRDRFPVWKGSLGTSDTIDHRSAQVSGFDAEGHLTMSCTYVTNNTGGPIDTNIGLGSDDSIQIFLNDVDLTAQAPIVQCRGWGGTNEEQDTVPVTLPPGESRLLVKVTDGCCGSGFRLRFQKDPQDPAQGGLMSPEITISLESKQSPRPGDVIRDLQKDSIGLGETVDVALNVSLKTASNVLVREVLPDLTQASVISDGGAVKGDAIEWNLTQVTQKTLSYKLAVDPCGGDLAYGQSTFKVGSTEVVVTGESNLTRTYRQDNLGTWTSADVASAGGSAERLGEHEVLVNASGAGVKLLKDEFHFVSLSQNGDFEISARIGCFDDPGSRGVAGLMIRDSADVGAANAFFALSSTPPTGGGLGTLKVSFRQDLNKSTSAVTTLAAADKDVAQLPVYLKLVRTGDKLSFQRSDNGTSYREILAKNTPADTRPIKLNPQALAGLAVTGGGPGSTRAAFEVVSGPPFGVVGARFRRGDTDGSGVLDLTDAISVLGRLFLGGAEPACLDAADADDSGVLDLTDAIFSLGWQFTGGAIPPAPGPTACGPDPSADDFKACVYPGC